MSPPSPRSDRRYAGELTQSDDYALFRRRQLEKTSEEGVPRVWSSSPEEPSSSDESNNDSHRKKGELLETHVIHGPVKQITRERFHRHRLRIDEFSLPQTSPVRNDRRETGSVAVRKSPRSRRKASQERETTPSQTVTATILTRPKIHLGK